ncbi:uncharacterized protein LOC135479318 [Liolophura sinensis]|uniref:uncharacterized protein LOC135479318 n=1 Tax=Liolophura sinensis TaxID=3198878 RepID=UPI003158523A
MDLSHTAIGDQPGNVNDLKLKAADLASLRGGVSDQSVSGSSKPHGPRQMNPHRLNKVQICNHPNLDLEHDANKEAFYTMNALVCLGTSLFSSKDGVLSLNRTLLGQNKLNKCTYRGIVRFDDNSATYTQELVRSEEPFEIVIKHDFFRIQCNLKNGGSRRLLGFNEKTAVGIKQENHSSVNGFSNLRTLKTSKEDADIDLIGINLGDDVNTTEYDQYKDFFGNYPDFGLTDDSTESESADFDQFIAQVYPSKEVFERIDGIRKEMKEQGQSQPHDPMNVLVFCLDSLSHLSYQRKLPLTYKFIKNALGATILHGYNIVGDATTANLLPLLTGKAHDELPETRSDVADSNYVDTYPLLWYKYERKGYATLFAEDEPTIGSFNLRLNGFEHQPTDHYMRPFWQTIWASSLNKDSMKYCLGNKPKHQYTLEYVQDFFHVYHQIPKFAFVMHAELTHWDNNPGQFIDADLTAFLAGLQRNGHLNNTVVILMGDHGARYSKVRWTVQGKLEERLPMMSWVIPDWFAKKYPKLVQNFKQNSHKLTTPYDIHETLLDVLDLTRTTKPLKHSDRGLSLFHSIPLNRTCKSAGIDMHWCTCLTQQIVHTSNEHVQKSVAEVMNHINEKTAKFRDLCEELKLKSIKSAMLVVPNEKVLRYQFSQDDDHRVANFSSRAKLDIAYYQVTIVTEPGEGLYEATVQANFLSSAYTINAQVSRVNKYGKQAECVQEKHPSIRKFCYCKPKQAEEKA